MSEHDYEQQTQLAQGTRAHDALGIQRALPETRGLAPSLALGVGDERGERELLASHWCPTCAALGEQCVPTFPRPHVDTMTAPRGVENSERA